jgi:hypothetical protein
MEETATTSTTTSHPTTTNMPLTELDIDAGTILRTGQSIFDMMRKWTKKSGSVTTTSGSSASDNHNDNKLTDPPVLRCSYVEIFMERAMDLLHPDMMTRGGDGNTISYVTIEQQQPPHQTNGTYVENSTEIVCNSMADVMTALIRGRKSRRTTAQRLKIGACDISMLQRRRDEPNCVGDSCYQYDILLFLFLFQQRMVIHMSFSFSKWSVSVDLKVNEQRLDSFWWIWPTRN